MSQRPTPWAKKGPSRPPHTVRLQTAFAGVPAGARLLISSPVQIEAFLRQQVPPGRTLEIPQLRRDLAAAEGADATCPVSTAIFLRIVAEAAWDELEGGAALSQVTPFWRVIDPASTLASKLRAGGAWIAQQRQAEASPV